METLVQKYEKLSKSKILIEANNNEYEINFEKAHFKHLAGIQYLNDIKLLNANATAIFNKCKSKKITLKDLKKSSKFQENEVDLRIEALNSILELFLNSKYLNESEFKRMYRYSRITSDVVIVFEIASQKNKNIFLHSKINNSILTPVSLYSVDANELKDKLRRDSVPLKTLYSWKIIYKKI